MCTSLGFFRVLPFVFSAIFFKLFLLDNFRSDSVTTSLASLCLKPLELLVLLTKPSSIVLERIGIHYFNLHELDETLGICREELINMPRVKIPPEIVILGVQGDFPTSTRFYCLCVLVKEQVKAVIPPRARLTCLLGIDKLLHEVGLIKPNLELIRMFSAIYDPSSLSMV